MRNPSSHTSYDSKTLYGLGRLALQKSLHVYVSFECVPHAFKAYQSLLVASSGADEVLLNEVLRAPRRTRNNVVELCLVWGVVNIWGSGQTSW